MTISYSKQDGTVSDELIAYYESRSNGVGIVVTGSTIITPNSKVFGGELAADRDDVIPSLQRLATAIKKRGAKAILQIFHGGRESSPELVPNREIVSASAVAKEGSSVIPQELKRKKLWTLFEHLAIALAGQSRLVSTVWKFMGQTDFLFNNSSPHTQTDAMIDGEEI